MKREIKTTLALDGEKKFKEGLADASRELRVLGSEMKANKATFAGNEQSLDSLTSRGKIFEKQVAQQKEVVAALARAVDESAEKYGEADRKTDGYRIQLNNATAALAKMERGLEENSQAIAEFGQDTEKTASKMDKFKEKAQQMADGLKNTGEKISGIGQKMSMYVTTPVVAAGVVAFKTAADVEDAMGAADQVFKGSADNMKAWADSLESHYGIAKGEALEYGNMMGSMLQNIGGLTDEEAAKQAQTLITLAGDLTAMYGGTTANAVQALTGALKGNNTMLDNYGMAANDALVKTKALEMGLYSGTGQMDLATKQAATLALIMEQSGAAQGQAAREAEGASGGMRAFATEVKNLSTDIGEVLLPIITPLLQGLGDIVKAFGGLSPTTQKLIVAMAGIAAAIGPVLIVTGKVISTVGVIMGSFGKLAAFLPILGTAFTVLTGPIGIVIAAVAALAAGVYLVINNWDKIKEFFSNLWDAVKNIFTRAWEAITNFLSGALQGIVSLFRQYTPVGIVLSQWDEIRNTISSKINAAKDAVRNALDAIYSFFANLRLPEIKIPKIKLPHFKIQGSFSLSPPRVPSFTVNWYKTGGIFDKPSIIGVGEAGKEAVIPLDKLSQILADTLDKIDTPRSGGGQVFVNVNTPVYLDGQVITRSTSRHQHGRNKSYSRAVGVTV